jgi:hypothetical protein
MKAKCPECEVYAVFKPVGPYRMMCPICKAVVKNEELVDEKEDADARE